MTDVLSRWAALGDEATAGPWRARCVPMSGGRWLVSKRDDAYAPHIDMEAPIASVLGDGSDARLIATDRNVRPQLAAVVKAANRVLDGASMHELADAVIELRDALRAEMGE